MNVHISLNIILDSISHYKYELHIDLPSDITFRRIALLPREMNASKPDCLYVCRLSEAMRLKKEVTDFYCMCLRDRIRDERETNELLSGLIVINQNMELEQLFSELQDTFVCINDWYEDMQSAIITQRSMQDIISMSEPIIGNFISVSDSALSLLAYTKNISTDDPTSLFLIENGYHSEQIIKKFKKYNKFNIWMNSNGPVISTDRKISKYIVINQVFKFNEIYFTHVVMMCNHREMTAGLLDLFNHLICVLSYYIRRNWEEKKDFDHVYNSLVVDLMQRKINDRDVIVERAKIVGVNPDEEYVVLLLSGGDKSNSIFPGLMAQDMFRMLTNIRLVYYNCRLLLFLHHASVADFIEEQDILGRLDSYFAENNVFCGVSDIFRDLLELPEAYRQAELSLNECYSSGQRGVIFARDKQKWCNIALFDTYYASCLLNKSEQIEMLWQKSKYGKILLELYDIDIEKNTNNLEVLHTYLMNERRATETANCLHMHRNNVIYRISRIEEMLQISLDDKTTRLNLMMSFQMMKYCSAAQQRVIPGKEE